jgi:hypothetical protein
LFGLIQWRHSIQRKKANFLLQQQKEKVESTLAELKSTQSQLIQSEKNGAAIGTDISCITFAEVRCRSKCLLILIVREIIVLQ